MDNLYQTQLLALARTVRDLPEIEGNVLTVSVKNPVCGDTVRLSIIHQNGMVTERHVAVEGCALCAAGAGYWYEQADGVSPQILRNLKKDMQIFLSRTDCEAETKMAAFSAVKGLKNRHKCVLLSLEASAKLADIIEEQV